MFEAMKARYGIACAASAALPERQFKKDGPFLPFIMIEGTPHPMLPTPPLFIPAPDYWTQQGIEAAMQGKELDELPTYRDSQGMKEEAIHLFRMGWHIGLAELRRNSLAA